MPLKLYVLPRSRPIPASCPERTADEIRPTVSMNFTTYSQFMNGLAKANIVLNRKALSNMAIEDKAAFTALVEKAKEALKA